MEKPKLTNQPNSHSGIFPREDSKRSGTSKRGSEGRRVLIAYSTVQQFVRESGRL